MTLQASRFSHPPQAPATFGSRFQRDFALRRPAGLLREPSGRRQLVAQVIRLGSETTSLARSPTRSIWPSRRRRTTLRDEYQAHRLDGIAGRIRLPAYLDHGEAVAGLASRRNGYRLGEVMRDIGVPCSCRGVDRVPEDVVGIEIARSFAIDVRRERRLPAARQRLGALRQSIVRSDRNTLSVIVTVACRSATGRVTERPRAVSRSASGAFTLRWNDPDLVAKGRGIERAVV